MTIVNTILNGNPVLFYSDEEFYNSTSKMTNLESIVVVSDKIARLPWLPALKHLQIVCDEVEKEIPAYESLLTLEFSGNKIIFPNEFKSLEKLIIKANNTLKLSCLPLIPGKIYANNLNLPTWIPLNYI